MNTLDKNIIAQFNKFKKYQVLRSSTKYELALKVLDDLINDYPNNVLYAWEIGYLYIYMNLFEEAIKAFRNTISLDASCLPAWGGLGHAYFEMSQWDEAKIAFRKRLQLAKSPNHYVFLSL